MERLNFNSSTSDRFTLLLNNSAVEHGLADSQQSSAHNFEALLEPPLDLGNLIYLKSKEAEVRLENLHISSLPLTFFQSAEEVIKTKLYIDPSLVRDNFVLTDSVLETENENQLQISVSDFHTHMPDKAIDYINSLLDNSANIYVIKRYMEIVADDDSIFIDTIFDNLSADQSVDQDIRVHDLALLSRYCDFSIFARFQLAKHLYKLINPTGNINSLLNTRYKYKNGSLDRLKEERQMHASKVLNSPDRRLNYNASLMTSSSPLKLIDLTAFYDIRLDKLNTAKTQDDKPTLPPELKTRSEKIKSVLITWLKMTNKMQSNNQITDENRTYIEQWFYNNISLIKMARKLSELIYNAIEKLKRPNSTIFSRQFLQLGLDRSQLKVKFHINKHNLVEKTSLKITFPPYVSYKLGSSLPTDSYNYAKLTKIKVGPITLANNNQVTSLFTNIITSEKQKTYSSIRFLPQLLCVKSSILAETGRYFLIILPYQWFTPPFD